ncbi:MAG TPA: DUF1579 domain-containing protein [Friedmanniella sp.]
MTLAEQFWDLLGSWTGVEEQSASPWSSASSARAALTFKLDLAGTAVLQDYRQVRAEGQPRERRRAELGGASGGSSPDTTEFLAHGVFLADGSTSGAVWWWLFDSVGNAPDPAPGVWDGPVLALTKTTPRGSAHHRFELAGDRLTYAIDLALTGQEPVSFLRGRYQRISGH